MHAAFLQAIREAPDDDVPRLVYADWLEDQGEAARAEFIRLQIDLCRPAGEREQRLVQLRRLRALIVQHLPGWLGKLGEWSPGALFERGFVESVVLEASTFLKEGRALFATHPLWKVRLWRASPALLSALLDMPEIAQVRALDLSHNNLSDEGAEALAAAPNLASLTSLDLSHTKLGTNGARALARTPHLRRLTALDLRRNPIGQEAHAELHKRFGRRAWL